MKAKTDNENIILPSTY